MQEVPNFDLRDSHPPLGPTPVADSNGTIWIVVERSSYKDSLLIVSCESFQQLKNFNDGNHCTVIIAANGLEITIIEAYHFFKRVT